MSTVSSLFSSSRRPSWRSSAALFSVLTGLMLPATLRAATGTWSNVSGGDWNVGASWLEGTPASGTDFTADFSTLNLLAAGIVTENSNVTIGTLKFSDTDVSGTSAFDWTLGGSGTITLDASTKPVIQVLNARTATISSLLAGTNGFLKNGNGTVVLNNAANTLTGGITLNAGLLNFVSGALGTNLVTFTGSGTLTWMGTNTQDISSQIKLGDTFTSSFNVTSNNVTFATPLQTGPLGTSSITKGGAGTLTITAQNTFTGSTRINLGKLILTGGDNRLSPSSSVSMGNAAANGVIQLGDTTGPNNQTITGLSINGTGTGNAIIGGATSNSTLTVNNSTASIYAGKLGGTGANDNNLALVKSGTGTLTLGGTNTFSGSVAINGGALYILNSTALGSGPKTVTISAATNTPSLQLDGGGGPVSLAANISYMTSNDDAASPAILNAAGNNNIGGAIALVGGGAGTGNTRIKSASGNLTLNGGIAPAASATTPLSVIFDGAATGTANGVLANGTASVLSVNKQGTGTWTLNGANTYTGATQIQAGQLILSTAQTGGSAITVSDGATLGITLAATGQTLNTPTLTLGSSAGGAVFFYLGNASNPAGALLNATSFVTAGTNLVNVAGVGLGVGTFPLIGYTGTIGGAGFSGLTLGTLPARVTGSLVNDAANGKVALKITAFDIPHWLGSVDNTWDIDDGTGTGTQNWQEVVSGHATRYLQGAGGTDSVRFDDTSGVPSNVILTTTLTPATVTVNTSTNAFVFSGAGKLSGATSLIKQGSTTLTLLNTGGNDYTGTTTISGGTIQVGDGATAGAGQLGSGDIIDNAALVLNRPDDLALSNVVSGSGVLTKQGAGALTLSGNNAAFTGTVAITAGTVRLGHANALGTTAGGTAISGGGILDLTGFSLAEPIQLGGGTVVATSGTTNGLTGPVTLNGAGTFDTAASTTLNVSGAIGGAGSLTKANAGTVILTADNNYTGGTTISQGTLQVGATGGAGTSGSLGSGPVALTPATGNTATLLILRGDNALNVGDITSSGAGTNAITIGISGATSPSGLVTFTGTNSFTGNLTIAGGALRILNSSGLGVGPKTVSIATNAGPSLQLDGSSGNIVLAAGINFVISSDGTIADFAANTGAIASLAGNNVINGAISLNNGGGGNGRVTVAAGSLTINGNIDDSTATGARALLLGGAGTGTVNGVVSEAAQVLGITKDGAGTWTLTGINTYTNPTTINGGTLVVSSVANGGTASNLGISNNTAAKLVINGGTLQYTGPAQSTNRNFTIGASGGTLDSSGSGALVFSNTAAIVLAGTNTARTLTLAGTNTGLNKLTGILADNGTGATSLNKTGTGTWLLGGVNSFTGPTRVQQGMLEVDIAGGLQATASVSVDTGGRLALGGVGALNRVNDNATFTLGGTLGLVGATATSETLGALSLSNNAIIDFGTGNGSTFKFLSLDAGSFTLSIYNWTGGAYTSGGVDDGSNATQDRLLFTNTPSGSVLSHILFYSDNGSTLIGSGAAVTFGASAEIAPVPEPSAALLGGLGLLGLLGRRMRRTRSTATSRP